MNYNLYDLAMQEVEKLKKENATLYKDRNEVFKLWDDHKHNLQIAINALTYFSNPGIYEDWQLEANGIMYEMEKPVLVNGITIAETALKTIKDNTP